MKHKVFILLFLSFLIVNNSFGQDKIYTFPEVMPQYQGGDNEMMKYLSSLEYPATFIENVLDTRIVARFVITKKGKIKHIQILKSSDKNFEAEFIKHIQAMPDWKPAMQDGKKVDCYYTIPITIHLQK